MKSLTLGWLICLPLLWCSCSHSSSDAPYTITSYPFQDEPEGRWGMIDSHGKVLFEDEFVNQPTVALQDRFMVRNGNGLWEIYTAGKNPQQIGKEYASAALFKAEVAPVSEPNRPIDFIDREGNVKFTLDRMDGLTVAAVNNYSEGLAVFQLSDGRRGAVDTEGNVVVPPQYTRLWNCSDGKLIAIKARDAEKFIDDTLHIPVQVLDKTGKTLFTFTPSEFAQTAPGFKEGYLAVGTTEEDGSMKWGVIDEKKQWVLLPSTKMRQITDIQNDKVLFNDGSWYGLMTMKGEQLIRPKYALLFFVGDDLLWASNDGNSFFLIDSEGNRLGEDECQIPGLFTGNQICPVKISENNWLLMRRDGSLIDKKSYADFGLDAGEDKVVNSDLHLEVLLKVLQPTATGMCGVSYSSSAEEVVRKVASKQYVGNFDNSRLIFYQKEVDGISLWGYVAFDNEIRIFRNGDWVFNPEAHPIGFKAMIMTDNDDRMQGKGDAIYAVFCKVIARIGKNKTWDEDGGQVYEVSDDSYAAAGLLDNQCGLFIAKKGVLMRGNDWDPDAYSSLTEDY